jgi:hypothetical protein
MIKDLKKLKLDIIILTETKKGQWTGKNGDPFIFIVKSEKKRKKEGFL